MASRIDKAEIIYKIAETEEEKEQSLRFVFDTYLQSGHIKKDDFPDGKMKDLFDERIDTRILIAVSKSKDVIGTLRVVRDQPHYAPLSLPLEKSFNLDGVSPRGDALAELSHFAVRASNMTGMHLIKAAILYAQQLGITHFIISCSTLQKNHFISFGFKQVGKEYFYKEIRHPYSSVTLLVDIEEGLRNMSLTNPLFHRIFVKPSPNILISSLATAPTRY
jgi:predicted GNAT family N-acyltransferase